MQPRRNRRPPSRPTRRAGEPAGPAPHDEILAATSGADAAPPAAAAAAAAGADPWATILQADAALLQGLATARASGGAAPGQGPFAIEHDPLTGQASVRLPLPDPQVLQQMARALAP